MPLKLCYYGNANTPQRFWVCIITTDSTYTQKLKKRGYCCREATATEIARSPMNKPTSLGKVADQFFQ